MKTLRINTVCGFGLGTSLILKMTLDDVFAAEGIMAEIEPCDVTSAAGLRADLIVTSDELYEQVNGNNPGVTCIRVGDFLDKELMKREVVPVARKLAEA